MTRWNILTKCNQLLLIYNYSIACSTKSLKEIRLFVRDVLDKNKIKKSLANLIVLAVDEACTNVIIHGNDCDAKSDLELEINATQNELIIKVKDTGDYSPSDLDFSEDLLSQKVKSRDKGGLGLFIINKIMDKVEYKTHNNTNFCLLSKKISTEV